MERKTQVVTAKSSHSTKNHQASQRDMGAKTVVKKPFLQLLSLRKLLYCILTNDNMDCVISLVSTIEVEKKRKKENLRIFPRSRKKERKNLKEKK